MEKVLHPIRAYRERKKLSTRDLGEILGVAGATVSRWETGARVPNDRECLKIHEKIGIPVRKLRPDLAALLRGAA
jgi:transcriptional regulator with XRE-family HTH domain